MLHEMREERWRDARRQAAALLAERGFEHVRAEELAAAMRVSLRFMYQQHGSKGGLARMLRAETHTELRRCA